MNFSTSIICKDRDGIENEFKYSMETVLDDEDNNKTIFRVVLSPLSFVDWFEFAVTQVGNSEVGKVTAMSHNNEPDYIAKGIPDKLIEEVSKVLQLTIKSSTNIDEHKSFETEWRSIAATKVWKRLEEQGKATYNPATDTFTYIT